MTLKVSSGTTGTIGKFVNATDLGNSVLFENAGKIGLGTTTPQDFLHARFTDSIGLFTGYAVQNLSAAAAAYSGMLFFDQNGALAQFQGFNNSTHEYRINNIAAGGSINFMLGSSSKFQVRADGDVQIPGSIRKAGSLFLHNLGSRNTAVGLNTLQVNNGDSNTAVGTNALPANTAGTRNTAVGDSALLINTTGSNNTALGWAAMDLAIGGTNTAVGYAALFQIVGDNNIGIGYNAGGNVTSGSNNIAIGNASVVTESGTIRIGTAGNGITAGTQNRTFIAGITGVVPGGAAVTVVVDGNGQLGVVSSSRRYKENIADMGQASSGLLRLRPVTYRYKQPYADGSKPGDYGLIAEEVAEVYPDLVVKGNDGQTETVQYHKLTPMLVNEMQKQNRHAQQQDETISQQLLEQQEKNRQLEARLAALESLLSVKVATLATARQ